MSEAPSKRRKSPPPEDVPKRKSPKRPAERAWTADGERMQAEPPTADERIAEILESIGDAFYALDRGWRFTYVNARACEFWGVPRESVLGHAAGDVFPAWIGSESHAAHRKAAAEGRPVRIETASTGFGRLIELNIFPSAGGLSVYFRDLSGLRRAEAERQAILDTMAQGVAVFDRDGEVMYRNAAARAILGIADDRVVPSYIGSDHPMAPRRRDGTPLPRHDHPVAHALRGEAVRSDEIRLTRLSDGREIVCRYDAVPLRDPAGTIVGAILTFQDITAQVAAEAALRQREELLRLAQEAAHVGSFAWDVQTNRVITAPSLAAIYGRAPEPSDGARDPWIDQIHPDDRPAFEAARSGAFARREREFRWQFRIIRRDGPTRWVEARSQADYDEAGRPQRVIGVQVDITAQKEAEERQGLLMAELDHRVKNILALVQAVAQQSLHGEPGDIDVFSGRLATLARTHSLLAESSWKGVGLRALVLDALAPYGDDAAGRFAISGPDLLLKPKPAQSLGMALHELATNAAKYGALSRPRGRVEIAWDAIDGHDPPCLRLSWIETGGPPVAKPVRRGFGSTVIERSLAYQLDGTVRLEFRRPGVHCTIELPFTPDLGRRQNSDDKTAPA